MKAIWEADVAEGAIAELTNTGYSSLRQAIQGATFTLETPDGVQHEDNYDVGNVAAGQQFPLAQSDAQMVGQADGTLASYGLKPVDVRILHPLGPALYVVASTPNLDTVKGVLTELNNGLLGQPPAFEGLYVEIQDSTGQPLEVSITALRNGSGGFWIEPGLNPADFGITNGGAPPAAQGSPS